MSIGSKAFATLRSELGINNDDRVWIGGHQLEAKKLATTICVGITKPPTGPLDAAIITPITSEEAAYFATKLQSRLISGGNIWIIVAENTDHNAQASQTTLESLTDDCAREALKTTGLQFVGCVPLNSDFKALAFKSRLADE